MLCLKHPACPVVGCAAAFLSWLLGKARRNFYLVITMSSQCFQRSCILKCPHTLLFSLQPSNDVGKPAGLSWMCSCVLSGCTKRLAVPCLWSFLVLGSCGCRQQCLALVFDSLGHLQQQSIPRAALVPSSDVQEMRIPGKVDGKLCPVKGAFLCA